LGVTGALTRRRRCGVDLRHAVLVLGSLPAQAP